MCVRVSLCVWVGVGVGVWDAVYSEVTVVHCNVLLLFWHTEILERYGIKVLNCFDNGIVVMRGGNM